MFNFKVVVTKRDGTVGTYELDFDSLCEFEEVAKVGVPVAFRSDNIRLGHLALMGWLAEKNAGNTVKPLATWRKDVVSVEVLDANPPTSAVD
jgi:hypothetical protein